MPVIATPTGAPTPEVPVFGIPAATTGTTEPVACAGQTVFAAPVSSIHGRPVLSRMRCVRLQQGQKGTIAWTISDNTGRAVDLSGCVSGSSASVAADDDMRVILRLQENLGVGGQQGIQTFTATIVDPAIGAVEIAVPKTATKLPGAYFGQLVVQQANGAGGYDDLFSNVFYVYIDRTNGGDQGCGGGPPSIMEIRLHLRDSGGADNFLLDNLKFDDAEMAMAVSRPIAYWNEIPPPLCQTYTTQNFPFRYHWLEGICGQLFGIAAEQYRSNQLSYTAAGVSIDDQNKEANYERAAAARTQIWKDFVRAKKASLNLQEGFGDVGSPYGYGYGYNVRGF
jgi:hypothetical protein